MHPNYLLAPRFDDANPSDQSRTSSMFSKRPHFGDLNPTPFNKNRPASVNKILPGSTESDLMKWLPLIKMVRKIQSKVKAHSMFLWCRLQNLTRIKLQNINSNKQNQLQSLNLPPQAIQQTLSTNPTLKPQVPHSISTKESENQSMGKIIEIEKLRNQDIKTNLCENDTKIIEQKNEHQAKIKAQKFINILQKTLESIDQRTLGQGHKQIVDYGSKKLSLQKFINIEFKLQIRKQLFTVMRMIKRYSHQVMKGEILGNTLKNCIRKTKMSVFHYLVQQFRISQEASKKQSLKKQKQNSDFHSEKEIIKAKASQSLETEEPTPKPILTSTNSSLNTIKLQNNQSLPKMNQIEFQTKLNSCQPLNLNFPKPGRLPTIFKEDKTVEKVFKNQNEHERLKKLGRLHPEEPFFEIPDISQITLFNPAINSNSALFQFASTKSTHTNFTSSLDTQFKSQQQTTRSKLPPHNFLDISPRLKEKSIESDSNKEFATQKSKPSTKVIFLKHSSSTNLKNNPQTPSSTKKIIGVFSKKRSIQLFSKDSISKNYEPKLTTCKSSIIKKSNNSVEIKLDKTQEQSRRKNTEMHSKQKFKDTPSANHRKVYKQNFEFQGISKTEMKAENSQRKVSKSSKVVQKFLDFSAKRVGTIKKGPKTVENKENQVITSFDKSSSRKGLYKNDSTKQNQLSEFNTLGGKIISYQDFIKQCPSQWQSSSGRKPLMEISENEPIFEQIQIEKDYGSNDLDFFYQSCSAQLPREREVGEAKCKRLRAKIDKIEMNTARKMKMEIENMINQRKKSSIGILKY